MPYALHPDGFHGEGKSSPFFEGWYNKVVTADGVAFAIIIGWYAGPERSFPFLMLLDGRTGTPCYVPFEPEQWQADDRAYDVRLGGCRFSAEGMALDVPELTLRGELRYEGRVAWPVTWLSPGCMGWYAWMPFMQCFHGVVSMDHGVSGSLELDGATLGFDGGRGYIEKDWGRGFPSGWVWLQCNHFDEPGVSVMVSVATIPWLGTSFGGFLGAVWHDGTLHRFTTYTRGRIERLDVGEREVLLDLSSPTHRLTTRIGRGERVAMLHAPDAVDMVAKVPECLDATVHARLETRAGELVWEGQSDVAALEVMGEIDRLRTLLGFAA